MIFGQSIFGPSQLYVPVPIQLPPKCPRCGRTDFSGCKEWVCYMDPNDMLTTSEDE